MTLWPENVWGSATGDPFNRRAVARIEILAGASLHDGMGIASIFCRFILMTCIAVATGVMAGNELLGPRTFTDVFGRSMVSEIVALSDEAVVMKRHPEGTEFSLPLDRLSDADRAFLANNHEKIVALIMPLPETEYTGLLRRDFRVLKKSGLALETVPARMWMRTRYFLIVYGLQDSPESTVGLIKPLGEQITHRFEGRPVSVLWLGPANRNGTNPPPVPEGDLKLAKVLPAGVAIVSVDAVRRDGALVDAEIDAISNEESPGNPRLFFQNYQQRPEAVRAVWRKRILARIPAYWPGCVYRSAFDKRTTNGVTQAFLIDREGRPVTINGLPLEGYFNDVAGYVDKLLADGHSGSLRAGIVQ